MAELPPKPRQKIQAHIAEAEALIKREMPPESVVRAEMLAGLEMVREVLMNVGRG